MYCLKGCICSFILYFCAYIAMYIYLKNKQQHRGWKFVLLLYPKAVYLGTQLGVAIPDHFLNLRISGLFFKMSPTNYNKCFIIFLLLKQSWVVVILRFMTTLNTWQCKCKHGNGNNHLHSWFSDFSLRKIIKLTKYTNFSSVVFHWIVCTLFHGKLTFGLPGIKMDKYTQWNNFTVVWNSSYSLQGTGTSQACIETNRQE